MIALLLLACGAGRPDSAPPFVVGVNYPWRHYGIDFGHNAWGHNGISAHPDSAEDDLAALNGAGVEAVRWFLFADGRAAPSFEADGTPAGLSAAFYADLHAALALADTWGVQVLFVLFDYTWLMPPDTVDGVQLFGRAEVFRDPLKRAALREAVLVPLLEAVGDHPAVLGWEVMNEPEWVIETEPELDGAIDEIVETLHAGSSLPVTVGSASLQELEARWLGRGLDWLQLHCYADPATLPPAAEIGDEPVLIGEFSTAWRDEAALMDVAWSEGYLGAWGWSLSAGDGASDLDLEAVSAWTPP